MSSTPDDQQWLARAIELAVANVAAGGGPFGAAFGSPSGAGAAWATTNDPLLSKACEAGAANCTTLSVVVASSRRRRLVMMAWFPGKSFNKNFVARCDQRSSVRPHCGDHLQRCDVYFTQRDGLNARRSLRVQAINIANYIVGAGGMSGWPGLTSGPVGNSSGE